MIPKTDKFKEECALIAIWNREEAANLAYLGLYAQQHRGQEGAGIVAFDQNTQKTTTHRGVGLVSDVFHNFDFSRLPGSYSIGHVRYSTAGESRLAEVQPFTAETSCGYMALAQNGNLVNADILRKELIKEGSIFSSTSDTEIILHLIAKEAGKASPLDSVIAAAKKIKGAFSLLIQFGDRLIALRDPNGFRPLSIAELDGGYILASETCAFDLLGAKYIRDLKAGEVLEIDALNNIESFFPFPEVQETPCIFEFVYFSRPDSFWYGESVHNARKKMGKILAREAPVAADLVIPVPDSGVSAALGYAEEAGLPFEIGLIRNHYVGRTFIEPKQSIRDFGAKVKHNPNKGVLKGKRIVVVDDSIVRGTTTKKLIKMLRKGGATEVHVRISAPPTKGPCFYGIDTPTKEQLIAHNMDIDGIRKYIDADSLAYLSIEGLHRSINSGKGRFCDACFSLNYPVKIPSSTDSADS